MRFFSCSLCKEKDARIADLREQVRYLRNLSIPNNSIEFIAPSVIEADAIISGVQHQIEIPEPAADDEQSERDRLLSGTY